MCWTDGCVERRLFCVELPDFGSWKGVVLVLNWGRLCWTEVYIKTNRFLYDPKEWLKICFIGLLCKNLNFYRGQFSHQFWMLYCANYFKQFSLKDNKESGVKSRFKQNGLIPSSESSLFRLRLLLLYFDTFLAKKNGKSIWNYKTNQKNVEHLKSCSLPSETLNVLIFDENFEKYLWNYPKYWH